jgi:hypothetical protein
MLNKIFKEGLYSDFKVIFNGKKFDVHFEYLKDVSGYFLNIKSNNFKEQKNKSVVINHRKVSGDLLESDFFGELLEMLYYNKNINEIINNKSIIDTIEYIKLCDYFVIEDNTVKNIKPILKEKINKYTCKTLIDNVYNINDTKHTYKDNCGSYCRAYMTGSVNIKSKFENTKTIAEEICKIYDPIEDLDYNYTNYLLELFADESFDFRRKIIGISNLKIGDLIRFDPIYHEVAASTYLFQRLDKMQKQEY